MKSQQVLEIMKSQAYLDAMNDEFERINDAIYAVKDNQDAYIHVKLNRKDKQLTKVQVLEVVGPSIGLTGAIYLCQSPNDTNERLKISCYNNQQYHEFIRRLKVKRNLVTLQLKGEGMYWQPTSAVICVR